MNKRLNIRISQDDLDKLTELRLLWRMRGDSETIRAMIRLMHDAEKQAMRQLRRVKPRGQS